ncbi:MAG: hypothetical protein ACQUYJ_16275, partial [Ferruginibacter sp.]
MKYILLFTISLALIANSFAQLTAEQRIEDSVIGWWNNNRFDKLKTPTDAPGKKKEVLVNKILEWVKKSYTPVAGLGTYSRYINKSGYGILFEIWDVSHDKEWTEPNGKFKPIPEQNTPFWVAVNRTFGSFAIPFLQKENESFFTMQPDGYSAADRVMENGKKADPRIHPNAYKYITWCNNWQTVYITPDNKLPFIAITKRELLQKAEEGLEKQMAEEIKDVQAKWPNNKKTQAEVLVIRKQEIEKYRSNIQKLRERHHSSLDEPAVIRDMQPTMRSFQPDPDIFKIDAAAKDLNAAYQVYKIDAALRAKMESDTPQWIAIAFPFATKEKGNKLFEMYSALSQNFNYDYVYNYFFNPEKVKGITYQPANEEQLIARLNNYRKTNTAAIMPVANPVNLTGNTFFFDDFSSSNEGGNPANWFFRKYGKHAVVSTLKNQAGKWLKLGYNTPVNPSLLKKPLPENFTLEYDVVTDGDFTSRTGGAVRLTLNTRAASADGTEINRGNGSSVSIELISGNESDYNNNNYRGIASIKINATPDLNKENNSPGLSYEYALREFTNKKTKIHVAVTVKNNILVVLINNKVIATSTDFKMTYGGKCITCGLPAGTRINTVFWNNTT